MSEATASDQTAALKAAVERFLEARAAADRELAAALLLLVGMRAERVAVPQPAEAPKPSLYKPKDIQRALGISSSRYYEIVEKGLLPYTRLSPGGNRVHLEEHLTAYRNYLLSQTRGDKRVWAPPA